MNQVLFRQVFASRHNVIKFVPCWIFLIFFYKSQMGGRCVYMRVWWGGMGGEVGDVQPTDFKFYISDFLFETFSSRLNHLTDVLSLCYSLVLPTKKQKTEKKNRSCYQSQINSKPDIRDVSHPTVFSDSGDADILRYVIIF